MSENYQNITEAPQPLSTPEPGINPTRRKSSFYEDACKRKDDGHLAVPQDPISDRYSLDPTPVIGDFQVRRMSLQRKSTGIDEYKESACEFGDKCFHVAAGTEIASPVPEKHSGFDFSEYKKEMYESAAK